LSANQHVRHIRELPIPLATLSVGFHVVVYHAYIDIIQVIINVFFHIRNLP
jgi:hypothetical protein